MIELNPNQPTRLKNLTCPYCNTTTDLTKEHVIGRRFVPKGTLNKTWNLILNACKKCNNEKAHLENDISAITMMPDVTGKLPIDDKRLRKESARKTKRSISHFTRKPMIESHQRFNIRGQLVPGVNIEFNLVGSPAVAEHRIFDLARLHLMGFFYLLTYDESERKGYFWTGDLAPINQTAKSDFGNPLQTSFARNTKNWLQRFICNTADGYFRAVIRRAPVGECWAWALEWNHSYRVIGYFGNMEEIKSYYSRLEQLEMSKITHSLSSRIETSLSKEDDCLFEPGKTE